LVTLLTQGSEPVLVTGKPGSGKTLSLIFTFFRLKKLYIEGRSPLVPIFMRIRELTPEVLDQIERMTKEPTVQRMGTIASQCPLGKANTQIQDDLYHFMADPSRARSVRFAFMLDGMDEFRDKSRYQQLFKMIKGCIDADNEKQHKFIVSCRVDEIRGYRTTLGAKIALIEPLNRRRVVDFLQRKLKSPKLHNVDRTRLTLMLSGLTSRTSERHLAIYLGNPYFLYLLMFYYAEQVNSPGVVLAIDIRILYRAELKRELQRYRLFDAREIEEVVKLVEVVGGAVAAVRLNRGQETPSPLRLEDSSLIERCSNSLLALHPVLQLHASSTICGLSNRAADRELSNTLGGTIQEKALEALQGDCSANNLDLRLPKILRLVKGVSSSDDEINRVTLWVLDKPAELPGRLLSIAVYGAVMETLGNSGILERTGDAIGEFKNQRLQDYFAASFIATIGLRKFASASVTTFWWEQALSIYFGIAEHPGSELQWLLNCKNEADVEHLVLCARCSAYIPESTSTSPDLQTALETLRMRLKACLKRARGLVDQFRTWDAYSEHLRRSSHVTSDELRSIVAMLRYPVPALREEYALALCAFVSVGGRLKRHWLSLLDYYLRLGFCQEVLPWRHWTPPMTTLRRWPSGVYVLVYGTAWLLNAVLSGATIALVGLAFYKFIADPVRTAGIQLSFSAFLYAIVFASYIGGSIYQSYGNPITPLFSFWVTPWYLVSFLWRSLHARGQMVWQRLRQLALRLNAADIGPEAVSVRSPLSTQIQTAVPTLLRHTVRIFEGRTSLKKRKVGRKTPPLESRTRTGPTVSGGPGVGILMAFIVFGLVYIGVVTLKERIEAPAVPEQIPVLLRSVPQQLASGPSQPVRPPTAGEQLNSYRQEHVHFKAQTTAFRRELKQFEQREGDVMIEIGKIDPRSVEQAREEYVAQTLDDKKFLDKLEQIQNRNEALLDRIQGMEANQARLTDESKSLMEVARSLKARADSLGEDGASLLAIEEELATATRNLLARDAKLKQGALSLVEIRLKCKRYRYLTNVEKKRLQALQDDFELSRNAATVAHDLIESLIKKQDTIAHERLSKEYEMLHRQSAESLAALTKKVDDADSIGPLGLWDVITTAKTIGCNPPPAPG
jgi:hypothetical protein